jgi:hypothetical protein
VKRILAALLLVALPTIALAQRDHGGGSRAPQPVARPAPVSRPQPQPQARVAPPANQGFNLNRDISPRPPAQQPQVRPQPQVRQQPAQRPARVPQPVARGFHGSVVHNPHGSGGAWYWNRGVAWAPAPIYWGGGFWGPWAFADLSAAILFGSIADANNDYGLQQTPCGPPNLVVIWGPDNSVICAFPNATVAPGNYQLDPSTLTIVSQ